MLHALLSSWAALGISLCGKARESEEKEVGLFISLAFSVMVTQKQVWMKVYLSGMQQLQTLPISLIVCQTAASTAQISVSWNFGCRFFTENLSLSNCKYVIRDKDLNVTLAYRIKARNILCLCVKYKATKQIVLLSYKSNLRVQKKKKLGAKNVFLFWSRRFACATVPKLKKLVLDENRLDGRRRHLLNLFTSLILISPQTTFFKAR